MRTWSNYQQGVFSFVESGKGNAIVDAVAGSGKSTTIVEAMGRIPKSLRTVFLAFNKAIATELKERGVDGRTFHSLCYTPVIRYVGASAVESNKLYLLVDKNFTGDEKRIYGTFCRKLVGLAKQSGIDCLIPNTEKNWNDIVEYHDLEIESDEGNMLTGIQLSQKLLRLSNESKMVDFDDLLYLAVKHGITLPKFDFVFVDEAQDTNAIQRAILRKIMNASSRIVAVGDPAQAIYGFRGADSNSLNLIAEEFNCIRLPLTVSYRCPLDVVAYAHRWVKHIEAAPNAPKGSVKHLGMDWKTDMFVANDLVVCRTTKPLIELAYKMLAAKMPCYIMGKEIGQGLTQLVIRLKAKGIDALQEKMNAWSAREIEKAIAKNNEAKAASIQDKVSAINCLIDSLPETKRTIPELLSTIEMLFEDKANATILATIHKSKGLEADNVYWLNSNQCPSKWAKLPWQQQQESNLCYVATTRAKKTLTTIQMEGV